LIDVGGQLPRTYFDRPTTEIARDLIGCRLVRIETQPNQQVRTSGIITETEAYCGETDLGCHAKAGHTARTAPLYGPPGFSYVYFTYGMHWLFNVVTRPEGKPEAVLIRAIQVDEGLERVAERRGKVAQKYWTDGPAKLTQALRIGERHNQLDLCDPKAIIFIELGENVADNLIDIGPRIGLYSVPEPWKSKPWRYLARI
jgi:DNA-3-methyladenine glycosylase